MAYCPNCGSSVEGRFCAKCGTAMPAPGAAAPPPPPAFGTPQGPPPPAYGAPPAAPPPAYGAPQAPPAYGQAPIAPPPSYGPGPGAPPPPGYQMGAPPPPPGYGPPQGYPPPGAQYTPQSSGMQENVASALCYAVGWITGIVFLVMPPYNQNRNVKFHAWQSIFFFGGVTVASIVLSIISGIILSSLSFGLWSIFRMVILVFDLAILGAWIFLMYKAYNNQRFVLPIVGPLAEKQSYS